MNHGGQHCLYSAWKEYQNWAGSELNIEGISGKILSRDFMWSNKGRKPEKFFSFRVAVQNNNFRHLLTMKWYPRPIQLSDFFSFMTISFLGHLLSLNVPPWMNLHDWWWWLQREASKGSKRTRNFQIPVKSETFTHCVLVMKILNYSLPRFSRILFHSSRIPTAGEALQCLLYYLIFLSLMLSCKIQF